MTASANARKGIKHRPKNTERIAGFQAGGMASEKRRLVVAGKVHSFVHAGDLLTIAVEHLRLYTIRIEER